MLAQLNLDAAWTKVDAIIQSTIGLIPNMIIAAVVFLILLMVASLVRRLVYRAFGRVGRENLGKVLAKLAYWTVVGLAFAIGLTIMVPSIQPGDFLAGLGIGSLAIGFAFKDILQNLLAGLLILIQRPFVVGDHIEVNGHEGIVDEIETRATFLKTFNGERVVIPNSDIYTDAVAVRTAFALRRSEYEVGIGYGDNIGEARDVIMQVLLGMEGVEAEPAPQVLTSDLAASWVTLKVRWWTHSERTNRVALKSDVLDGIKNALDDAGIDMPFETQVHLQHDQTDELDGDRARQREGWPLKKNDQAPKPLRLVEPKEH